MEGLMKEIQTAINKTCSENGSNTPDFILAEYLTDCLAAFEKTVKAREKWYGIAMHPGQLAISTEIPIPPGWPGPATTEAQAAAPAPAETPTPSQEKKDVVG